MGGPISRFDTTSKENSFLDYCLVVKNYTILLTKTLRVEWVRKLLRIPTMIWIMREFMRILRVQIYKDEA